METKKEFKWFTIFEYKKEQEYLREMHRSGLKFTEVRGIGVYHFEKCTPEDVIYQLDYNQEGLAHKDEYIRMFNDFGWEYLQDYVGYSYFRKPVSESGMEEEIFCDEESRLAMLKRVLKGRMLPLLIIFCCVLLPQFILNLSMSNYTIAAFLGTVTVVYIAVFTMCAAEYMRCKK